MQFPHPPTVHSASHLTSWPPKCRGLGLRPGPHIEKAGFGFSPGGLVSVNWLWKPLKPQPSPPSQRLLLESSALQSATRSQRWYLRTAGGLQGRNVPPAPLSLPLWDAQGQAGQRWAETPGPPGAGAPEPEFRTHAFLPPRSHLCGATAGVSARFKANSCWFDCLATKK